MAARSARPLLSLALLAGAAFVLLQPQEISFLTPQPHQAAVESSSSAQLAGAYEPELRDVNVALEAQQPKRYGPVSADNSQPNRINLLFIGLLIGTAAIGLTALLAYGSYSGSGSAAGVAGEREDPDYDPFAADTANTANTADTANAGPDTQHPPKAKQPGDAEDGEGDDDDDDGDDDLEAFNALIELMRTAEQPPSAPQSQPQPQAQDQTATPKPKPAPTPPWASKATLPRPSPAQREPFVHIPATPYPPTGTGTSTGQPAGRQAGAGSARPLDAGEEVRPKRIQPTMDYEYNPATKRWEPAKPKAATANPKGLPRATPSRPFQPGAGDGAAGRESDPRSAAPMGYAHHRVAADPRPQKNYVIAECEMEARADEAKGSCDFMQALAVRLALRFESRPAGILSCMAEAGLPAAKDQRSTVKAIMRLCHPDKCKHPEAKRAMQILSPLLQ